VTIHNNGAVRSISSNRRCVGRKFLVVPALSLLLAIGCGDGDKGGGSSIGSDSASSSLIPVTVASRNEQWAAGLCVAMTAFESDIAKLSGSVSFFPSDNAQKIKDTLVRFLQEAEKRSARLQSDVRSLGNPEGKDGRQIQEAMVAASGQLVSAFARSVAGAQALATDGAIGFESGVAALGDSIDAASEDISSAFQRIQHVYDASELDIVIQSTSECRGAPF